MRNIDRNLCHETGCPDLCCQSCYEETPTIRIVPPERATDYFPNAKHVPPGTDLLIYPKEFIYWQVGLKEKDVVLLELEEDVRIWPAKVVQDRNRPLAMNFNLGEKSAIDFVGKLDFGRLVQMEKLL